MTVDVRLWSVTELLKMAIPSPAITGWAVRITAEAAVHKRNAWLAMAEADPAGAIEYLKQQRWATSGKAADRGNALHRHAQALALGAPPPEPEAGAEAHVAQFVRFLDDHAPVYLAAEAPVYNLAYSYAGTLDAIVQLGDRVCVLDYKTTDKGPEPDPDTGRSPSRPPYSEVALQLCAYARAEMIGTGPPDVSEVKRRRYYTWRDDMPYETMPQIDGALALMVSPVDYELHPVRVDDDVWACFLHAREVARWVLEVSRNAIGPAVAPPARPAGTDEAAILADADALIEEGVLVEPGDDDEDFGAYVERLRDEGAANGGQAPAPPTGGTA